MEQIKVNNKRPTSKNSHRNHTDSCETLETKWWEKQWIRKRKEISVSFSALPLAGPLGPDKLIKLSEPQFHHLETEDDNIYLTRRLRGSSQKYMWKFLAKCLGQ